MSASVSAMPFRPLEAVALAAVLSRPWADVVLCGAATVEQLRSNVRALNVPDAEVKRALQSMGPEAPERYWEKRASLPWN